MTLVPRLAFGIPGNVSKDRAELRLHPRVRFGRQHQTHVDAGVAIDESQVGVDDIVEHSVSDFDFVGPHLDNLHFWFLILAAALMPRKARVVQG